MSDRATSYRLLKFGRKLRHRIRCGHWPADPDVICWYCEMEWQRRHR